MVTACTVSVCVIIHYYCYEYYRDLIGSFPCALLLNIESRMLCGVMIIW